MTDRQKSQGKNEFRYHLAGWTLFVICAIFFIASGLINRDMFTLIGSGIFLFACILFLIPLVGKERMRRKAVSHEKVAAVEGVKVENDQLGARSGAQRTLVNEQKG